MKHSRRTNKINAMFRWRVTHKKRHHYSSPSIVLLPFTYTHFLHFTSNTATVAVKSNSEAASRRLDHSVSSWQRTYVNYHSTQTTVQKPTEAIQKRSGNGQLQYPVTRGYSCKGQLRWWHLPFSWFSLQPPCVVQNCMPNCLHMHISPLIGKW